MGRPYLPNSPRRLYRAEYWTWQNILRRCEGKGKSGQDYLDRGITVCEQWRDFEAFLADMGPRPSGGPREWTIERVDNEKGYSPDN